LLAGNCLQLDSIRLRRGLASDQHAHRTGTSVQDLMRLAGRDLEPFAGAKNEIMLFDFERQFAFEDEEELTRM
jgi:hypothetical protein